MVTFCTNTRDNKTEGTYDHTVDRANSFVIHTSANYIYFYTSIMQTFAYKLHFRASVKVAGTLHCL